MPQKQVSFAAAPAPPPPSPKKHKPIPGTLEYAKDRHQHWLQKLNQALTDMRDAKTAAEVRARQEYLLDHNLFLIQIAAKEVVVWEKRLAEWNKRGTVEEEMEEILEKARRRQTSGNDGMQREKDKDGDEEKEKERRRKENRRKERKNPGRKL
ncbi:hypothetical protein F5Y08DRAFT_342723 [Xylaria arbuscula]|nr:hypothetical protein F5Y08DRAFT_342723 [Xylaria arbuscula]